MSLWQDPRLAVCKVGQEICYLQILLDSMMNTINYNYVNLTRM